MKNLRLLSLLTMLVMSSTASTQSDKDYAWLADGHHTRSGYSVR